MDFQLNEFENELTGLYVIGERTSRTVVAGPIPARSDLVALFGFIRYLKEQEKREDIPTNPQMYSLGRIGLMAKDGQIVNTNGFRIATGDTAQQMYDDMVQKALQEDDE